MVTAPSCPGVEILKQFLIGQTSEEEAQHLEEHLLSCARCLETARSLPLGDTLISSLQQGREIASRAPGSPLLEPLRQGVVSLSLVQDTAAAVAAVVQIKEEQWHYATPKLIEPIATISMGVDGTRMLVVDDGKRQAMVGTISLFDKEGERHHTIYVAASPLVPPT